MFRPPIKPEGRTHRIPHLVEKVAAADLVLHRVQSSYTRGLMEASVGFRRAAA